ncbi:outer membrane biogenesis protein BamB [Pirellulimonas nuda]|uniref:Outer membrane biogenesis protein BamB n=1 Tax=Pirellulimonas nuda TaxID=2528009 RepID=A0A518DIL3_9BACT|nr:PQQ-binding-like beta-propeller repeat protein [Pirellulimonas nuda]QDU91323.1 outer membrane biogenesis protein BamB [Pirellulimonas nuda]
MRPLSQAIYLFCCLAPLSVSAEDWPQWRGAERDGEWNESGVRQSLPEGDLPAKWRTPVALGYAGPAVADGKVYLFDYKLEAGDVTNNAGARAELQGEERLLCLDAATGEELWKHTYPRQYQISYPSGPRCTPTVDGDRVYTLGAEGDLRCLKTSDGSLVWKKFFPEDFGAKTPIWGHSAHPLVYGDLLICVVGGEGSVAVAFNKETGEEAWRALTSIEPGYCPPTLITHGGNDQVVIWDAQNISGLDPKTGEVFWSLPLEPSYAMSIMAPQQKGDLLYASGIGNVGALMRLDADGRGADYVWTGKPKTAVYCSNSTPYIDGDTIYGVDMQQSALIAVDLESGQRLWQEREPVMGDQRGRHGTAFLVRRGDQTVLFNELGDLIFATLTRDGYTEHGRTHLLEPTGEAFGRPVVWSHPAFAQKCVFARNDKEIVCVDLSAEGAE